MEGRLPRALKETGAGGGGPKRTELAAGAAACAVPQGSVPTRALCLVQWPAVLVLRLRMTVEQRAAGFHFALGSTVDGASPTG